MLFDYALSGLVEMAFFDARMMRNFPASQASPRWWNNYTNGVVLR